MGHLVLTSDRLMLVFYIMAALLATNIALNTYTIKFTLVDFQNTTKTDNRQIIDILKFRYGVENHFRTNYAWDFNTGQKLDRVEQDLDLIKDKLGLVDNFTYAGPTNRSLK